MKADLILMIEEGRIIEQGTHDQLLTHSEKYREFYNLQRPAATRQVGEKSKDEYSSIP
jgi:ABC-type transport system involved in cytochrome bd biosynthesis fused ATPase/permease subunit